MRPYENLGSHFEAVMAMIKLHGVVGKCLSLGHLGLGILRAVLAVVFPEAEAHELAGNHFLLLFPDEVQKSIFLDMNSWVIKGLIMNFIDCSEIGSFGHRAFNLCKTWVQVHGVQAEVADARCVRRIANLFGKVDRVQHLPPVAHSRLGSFRMRVPVRFDRPLMLSAFIRHAQYSGYVTFRYEKYGPPCPSCGLPGYCYCTSTRVAHIIDLTSAFRWVLAHLPSCDINAMVDFVKSSEPPQEGMPTARQVRDELELSVGEPLQDFLLRFSRLEVRWPVSMQTPAHLQSLWKGFVKCTEWGAWNYKDDVGTVEEELLAFVFGYGAQRNASSLLQTWTHGWPLQVDAQHIVRAIKSKLMDSLFNDVGLVGDHEGLGGI
ncbi:MAG: DUF4283 domain-containing protein ['Waltheria sp.' little leaf phytoplasma]|nr:DUF4283 domain-containing protein ['Waltheria sp.' little leaf phytoplasma]